MRARRRTGYGLFLPVALLGFAGYFVFAAVQGEYGVFRRVELEAEYAHLSGELALLDAEVDRMSDRTRRLSDDFLDLDLLDERARMVLGLARTDEIVIE
ncbi:MAG: septum formation initiator family protein [Pseudomonadota bacterium]